jgi:site-specific DNA recombinase
MNGNGISSSSQGRQRCAIYTRKSSEEGLDQEFNSLDAQYEACAAFIASQAGLGWKLVSDRYDDGGISGGTMERSSLQRLLQDIRDRKIDVVVVYKIDRLTRSLMDFARMVEIFDASSVSFVSVTQQFNTTTSMGRLTLNVLLSFAQFEREVTAERIRDKIAASRKRGMWMGGRVPVGYMVINRKLMIDAEAAHRVRHLFRRYLELGSVPALANEIDRAGGVQSAAAGNGQDDGVSRVSRRMSRGQLYHLLSNPVYIGKSRHHDQVYDGEHEGIIDPTTFRAVQARLADQTPNRRSRSSNPDIHLLTGLVYDETGDQLSPTHAYNHGKRYRYYVSKRLRYDASAREGSWRIPAEELERIVLQQAKDMLQDRSLLAGWLQDCAVSADRIEGALSAAARMWVILHEQASTSGERSSILQTMFRAIRLSPDRLLFEAKNQALVQRLLLAEDGEVVDDQAAAEDDVAFDDAESQPLLIDRPIAIKRRGVEARIVISGASGRNPDSSLVDLIARAHLYLDRLTDGSVSSIAELAGELTVHRADISRILPLAFLSPDITDMILTGRQPADLTVRTLARLIDIPPAWTDQAKALGA